MTEFHRGFTQKLKQQFHAIARMKKIQTICFKRVYSKSVKRGSIFRSMGLIGTRQRREKNRGREVGRERERERRRVRLRMDGGMLGKDFEGESNKVGRQRRKDNKNEIRQEMLVYNYNRKSKSKNPHHSFLYLLV
ncbi:hypothetical protein EYC80_000975 [Monilinia laxa]|uniref:Uncharacterized protein n=1 Tax=Monilinia laxa TaxID=61186 RepID=A0A5N6K7Q4_MONLA|nr:hypothetical protein EYC80_000975 [Monilinia laxa]